MGKDRPLRGSGAKGPEHKVLSSFSEFFEETLPQALDLIRSIWELGYRARLAWLTENYSLPTDEQFSAAKQKGCDNSSQKFQSLSKHMRDFFFLSLIV